VSRLRSPISAMEALDLLQRTGLAVPVLPEEDSRCNAMQLY
jgi:hypothetical protein